MVKGVYTKLLVSPMNLHGFSERIKEAQVAPKRGSERAEVIGFFFEKLKNNHLDENGEQKFYIKNGKKVKVQKMTIPRLGMMLAPIKSVKDLRAFYSECLYHDSPVCGFSKWFWWSMNPKNFK